MADKKVSDFSEDLLPTANDLLLSVDAETNQSKKVKVSNIVYPGMVNDAKMDYPRWWQEIGRTTLAAAGDIISVSSLPLRKYLQFSFYLISTGGAIQPHLRINNDTANNYNFRYLLNYATASGAVNQSTITMDPGSSASETIGEGFIVNVGAQEKIVNVTSAGQATAGAGNQATVIEVSGKWANASQAISRIDVINLAGAGDFAIGSELVIRGHD